MGIQRSRKQLAATAIALAGLAGGAAAVHAATFANRTLAPVAPSTFPSIASTACSTDPCEIALDAGPGTVTVQDVDHGGPQSIDILGFNVNGANGGEHTLAGGATSTIKVPVNTHLHITLTGVPLDLSFPSLPVGDVVHNNDGTYSVTASKVGTMVFQPGGNADAPKQIAQGLVGVLIVTPTGCDSCAFDAGAPTGEEALVATADIDAAFAANPPAFDMGYFGQAGNPDGSPRQVYHLLNGKSFPDTDVIDVQAGDDVLLRYVNAGVTDKTMGLLGMRQTLLGRNAEMYTDPQTFIAPMVGPGETADVVVHVPSTAGAASGHLYSLMDQGRQMNHGTSKGFGGALTFLDVWPQTARVDTLSAAAQLASAVAVGNPLIDRAYATDFPAEVTSDGLSQVLVVLDGSPLPAGTLQSFDTWNQATTGSSPTPSAGKQLHAYVLRPTGNPNEFTVVYDSGVLTVPALQVPGVSEHDTFPANVAVNAGDVIGYFGSGVPVDVGAGTDVLSYPATTPPTATSTITLGDATDPVYPQARTYSFAATVAPYSGTTTLTATGHSSGATHDITGFQTVVNAGAVPAPADWSATTAVAPAATVSISTSVSAVPGQTVWIRVQQDGSLSSDPASIVVPAP